MSRVTVRVFDVDQYRRIVAHIYFTDGRNLNRELLKAGYAWWYKYYSDDESLGELEKEAREARRGLWADPDPEPPWDYRRRQRGKMIFDDPMEGPLRHPAP